MFKWLTNVFTGKSKRRAEILALKGERDKHLDECRTEALSGDQDATVRLRDYEKTVGEQSLRFLRKTGAKVIFPVLFLCLALAMGGCVTKSTTTEGDREVLDQTQKGAVVAQEAISKASSLIDEGKSAEAKSMLEIGARAGLEVQKNMDQQLQVHGAPESPQPFSAEASAAARKKSTDEHSTNTLGIVLGVAGAAAGIAATLAGMPWLAQVFPALTGKIGKWAKTGSQIITAARAVGEANGGSIQVTDLLKIAKDKNVSAGIQSLVTKHVDAHEEEMGHDFALKLEGPAVPAPQA